MKNKTEEDETGVDENDEPQIPPLRRSTRKTKRPYYYGEWINSTDGSTDPSTVSKAFSSSEKKLWKEAMQAEFQSIL